MRLLQRFTPTLQLASTVALVAAALALASPAQAQSYNVIYAFHGSDGEGLQAGLTMDGAGNLYGTTSEGGSAGGGTAFQLIHRGTGWVLNPLHVFTGSPNDGYYPYAGVVFGRDGRLYGTTYAGGIQNEYCGLPTGCGTVFSLTPPPTVCKTTLCPWTEEVIHAFYGPPYDGSQPGYGGVAFDQNGNLYGTTWIGGPTNSVCPFDRSCGIVYQMSPSEGGWTETVIYDFQPGAPSGSNPLSGVVVDNLGNLYGTTLSAVYELTPAGNSWSEATLASRLGSVAGVFLDQSGNLYGMSGQVAYELSPTGSGWNYSTLYTFGQDQAQDAVNGFVMDAAGNLYGAGRDGGLYGHGAVFKLSPSAGEWTYTSLHDFTGGSDGRQPYGRLLLDANGNVYGTTLYGGNVTGPCPTGCGVVFEITP
jgi:uncharacterized repeat protein (TIGR03803 family)